MTGRRAFLGASAGAAAAWLMPERCTAAPVALSLFVRREIDNLLKPGLQAIETGYQRLENGMLMMSALNKMVGCKFRMLDWWVRNYTAEDYKRCTIVPAMRSHSMRSSELRFDGMSEMNVPQEALLLPSLNARALVAKCGVGIDLTYASHLNR